MNKKSKTKTIVLILLLLLLNFNLMCQAKCGKLNINTDNYTNLIKTDFSNKSIEPWNIQANKGDITIVPNPQNIKQNVLKAHININEDFSHVVNGAPRAEILNSKLLLASDSRYIIKFKTYFPKNFQIEKNVNPSSFFQIHQTTMSGSPQLAIGVDGNFYRFTSNSSEEVKSEYKPVVKNLGSINSDLGKWTEWIILYKPSYSQNGEITIFKNRLKILDYKGVCAYNDASGYLKFGLYKWNWKKEKSSTTDISTYYSNIEIYKEKTDK